MNSVRRSLARLGAATLAIVVTGCFNPFAPRVAAVRGISEPAPRPDQPIKALRLFEWCWEHRSIAEYEELFTEDFRFVFATADTSGNAYLERGFTREDELASARHLFQGGDADQPAASRITIDFDPNLVAFPDSRPGKTYPWHVEILTRVVLSIDYPNRASGDRIDGSARFFMVRGDSAQIPEKLRSRLGPDPNRWYIERYEEESDGSVVARATGLRSDPGSRLVPRRVPDRVPEAAMPVSNGTWGRLKAHYARPPVVVAARSRAGS